MRKNSLKTSSAERLKNKMVKALNSDDTERRLHALFKNSNKLSSRDLSYAMDSTINDDNETVITKAHQLGKLDVVTKQLKESERILKITLSIKIADGQYDQSYIDFVTYLLKKQYRNHISVTSDELAFLMEIAGDPDYQHLNTHEMQTIIGNILLDKFRGELITDVLDTLITIPYDNLIYFHRWFFTSFRNYYLRDSLKNTDNKSLFQWLISNFIHYFKQKGYSEEKAQYYTYERLYLHSNNHKNFLVHCRTTDGFEKHLAIGYALKEGVFDYQYDFDADQKLQELNATNMPDNLDGTANLWHIDYLPEQLSLLFRKSDTFFKIKIDDPFIDFSMAGEKVIIELPTYNKEYEMKCDDFDRSALRELFNTLIDWQCRLTYNNTCHHSSAFMINENDSQD